MSASTAGVRPLPTSPVPPATAVPHDDRLPDEVLAADPRLVAELTDIVGADDVLASATDRTRYATDASPYRLLPQVVVRPRDASDLQLLMRWAASSGHHLTFRAGGTSLNGQAQGDGVLVDLREHFGLEHGVRDAITVLDDGLRVRVRPGVVLARVNAVLARHGRMLGPDPASSAAATVGGVLANNASGMTCGVHANSFRTIESVVAVLASGTLIDTGAPDADERLAAQESELCRRLLELRDEVRSDTDLSQRLRRKFSIKNTSGLRLDAFLEADSPARILTLLLVGSEGILGAVVDTVWRTVPLGRRRSTGFLHFPDARTAASVVSELNAANAQTVELIDAASLQASKGRPGTPAWVDDLPPEAPDAVILTERRAEDEAELDIFDTQVARIAGPLVVHPVQMTHDPRLAADYWRVRSGLLAIVGAARPARTSLITEDIVVPPDRLPDAITDLQHLLEDHGFLGAVNGHAGAGNLHFYLYLDATSPEAVANYRAVMTELVELVVDRYDGSLKGEHGTGRNMAPFIAREWGERAMDLMWQVKRTLDPQGILAPGVFLNDDPEAAFTHLKSMPVVDPDLDPCIECGFCEPVCPSRHLTTTPRQRIVVQREMARRPGPDEVFRTLAAEYRHDAVDTCAGDSSCALACPVGIDTGHAMKRVREDAWGAPAQRVGATLAQHWGTAARGATLALGAAHRLRPVIGDRGLAALTGLGRRLGGSDLVPSWLPEVPGPPVRRPQTRREGAEAVYFTACINRIFGPSGDAEDATTVAEALVSLAGRAGHPVWIPDDVDGFCCATVWQSKGLDAGNARMAQAVVDALWRWSDGGELPVVVDASSCTLGLLHEVVGHLDAEHRARHEQLTIVDAMTFVRNTLVPELPGHDREALAVVHPTCSMQQLGITDDLRALAGEVAGEVFEPLVATCCAFAGDRGMLHPELTESATREEAAGIRERLDAGVPGTTRFVSGNRTCELGMEHATHEPWESVVVALERLTR